MSDTEDEDCMVTGGVSHDGTVYNPDDWAATFDWGMTKPKLDALRGFDYALQQSAIAIDSTAPNFSGAAVVRGEISELAAADYRGKWVLLFFYPLDFTFVCPTEVIAFNDRVAEFRRRNCEVVAASCDSAEVHLAWMRTKRTKGGLGKLEIPLLADVDRRIARAYGVLSRDNYPNRGMFLIDDKGRLKSMQINQNDVGRSVDEALRLLDAYQFVAENGVVCPADWKPGASTMVAHPEKSLEYFAQQVASGRSADAPAGTSDGTSEGTSEGTSSDEEEPFGQTLESVTSMDHFQEITSSDKLVVVDFMASWCGKCRMLAPFVEQLQNRYKNVAFYKFDTSEGALEAASKDLGIKALPAFRFYKAGKEVVPQVTGYKRKPLEEAIAKLSKV